MNTDPGQFRDLNSDPNLAAKRIALKSEHFALLARCQFGVYTFFDQQRIDRGLDGDGLDFGFRWCMRTQPTASLFLAREPIHAPQATREEAEVLRSAMPRV